jgi:hypothetical protein
MDTLNKKLFILYISFLENNKIKKLDKLKIGNIIYITKINISEC